MMATLFTKLFGRTIRRQLITGVALVHLILMSIFVYDMTVRQQMFLLEKSIDDAQYRGKIFAFTSKEFLRTNDLAGLQELLNAYLQDHGVEYAMVVSAEGKVLSHSDESKRGLFLRDSLSLAMLSGQREFRVLSSTNSRIDVAVPIIEGESLLGWVRIVNDLSADQTQIEYVSRQGVIYTAIAIIVGTLFAFGLSLTMLRQLRHLLNGATRAGNHQWNEKIPVITENEIGSVSKAFNLAMEKIAQQEEALCESETTYRLMAENASDVIWIFDTGTRQFRYISPSIVRLRGLSAEEAMQERFEDSVTAESLQYVEDVSSSRIESFNKGESHFYTDIIEQPCRNGSTVWVEMESRYDRNERTGHIEIFGISRNITQRRNAERALRESEEQLLVSNSYLLSLVNSTSSYLVRTDMRGKYTYVNEPFIKKFGFRLDELMGKDAAITVCEEDLELMNETVVHCVQQPGVPVSVELRKPNPAGGFFITEWEFTLISDAGGVPQEVQCVGRDITERRFIEKALIDSERKYRNLVEFSSVGVFQTTVSGEVLYVNNAIADILEYDSTEEIRALGPFIMYKYLHQREEMVRLLRANGNVKNYEVTLLTKHHQERFVVFNIVLSGDILDGTLIDISERKRAEDAVRENEEKYRGLVENSPDAIAIYSEGRIVFVNNQCISLMRVKSAEELIGRSVISFVHPEDRSRVIERMKNVAVGGVPLPSEQERFVLADGETIDVEVKAIPTVFDNNPAIQIIVRDITERKKNDQIILDVQRRESLGVLAGGIAHDFNNLLGVMMGNISLAQHRLPPGDMALKNIERAKAAMDRAAILVKQMLAYSGKGKFQIREIDLVALIKEHIDFFEVSLPKNVRLDSMLSSKPTYVKGDPAQIEQIVMNLIINGGEAIGVKQGVVSISISSFVPTEEELNEFGALPNSVLKKGPYALLKVADNGEGMNDETRKKIFDPFFTTKFVGRGLGLSAVLGIIRANDGGIIIESEERKGTTFSIILPLIHPTGTDASLSAALGVLPAKAPETNILVIDDERDVVEMTIDILESGSYSHTSAIDPEIGIRIYQEHCSAIDAVILDFSMPKLNGKEVIIELRKINPNVRVIIASGYTEEEIFKLMGDEMPNAFIAKPYTQKDLLELLKKVLK
ncbi:MAG: PAS domain S-box protein [Bacteroidota bacterium]